MQQYMLILITDCDCAAIRVDIDRLFFNFFHHFDWLTHSDVIQACTSVYVINSASGQTKLCHHPPPSSTTHHQPKYLHHYPPPTKIYPPPMHLWIFTFEYIFEVVKFTTIHDHPPTAKTFFYKKPIYKNL